MVIKCPAVSLHLQIRISSYRRVLTALLRFFSLADSGVASHCAQLPINSQSD